MKLEETIRRIPSPSISVRQEAKRRWDSCGKPLGSLGLLEDAISDIAALNGDTDVCLTPRAVLVLCADNGVVAQGVTQTDSSVTGIVAQNLAAGRTSVCRMASCADCEVIPVDVGIKDFTPCAGVISRRIGNGTDDISAGPAMTREQVERAILTGIELVGEQKVRGIRLLATGEMGIGNTTTTSAVASVLLGRNPLELTGRGAGLSDAGLERKRAAIQRAIAVNRPNPDDPVDILQKVGGFDLAALCGVFLGGALYRIPILMDGVISSAAALCAVRLCPTASGAVLASHASSEPASRLLLEALSKRPLITAEMRLGEGTGAVAAMPLLDMARTVYAESYTFEDAGIEAYTPQGIGI